MIVSPRGDRLVMVRQVDHQEQCALMADAWGNDDFARPEPFGPLRTAGALHDEGWRAWERAPRVGEDGSPVDFTAIDRATHVELYRAGIRRAIDEGPRVGLLVSLHGQGLYEGRKGLDPGPVTSRDARPPAVRAFLDEQDAVQDDLRARIGADHDPAWEWAAYRLLQTWDALSLHLTWRALPAGRPGALPQVPRAPGDPGVEIRLVSVAVDECAVAPWPFAADRVALPVRAREIPPGPYRSDAALADALARARWRTLDIALRPA